MLRDGLEATAVIDLLRLTGSSQSVAANDGYQDMHRPTGAEVVESGHDD